MLGRLGADQGSHRCPEELDRLEPLGVWDVAEVHLQDVASVAERTVQVDEASRDLIGPAGEDHPVGAGVLFELRPAAAGRPPPGSAAFS